MPLATDPTESAKLSVQERAEVGFAEDAPFTFWIARVADEIPSYGDPSRDEYLDEFWRTEPMLAGAVYSMCAKVAALDFKLVGPEKTRSRYKRVLMGADLGQGWVSFVMKVTQDLLTSDNGAFIELLREPDEPATAPVRGVAHLDSHRCTRTGDVEEPVIYTRSAHSRKDTKQVKLKWWEVMSLADMPSPRENMKGKGFCAVSRVLHAAQILRDIGIYKRQKLGGKRIPGLLFAQGIRRNSLKAALQESIEEQRSRGDTLYSSPIIVSSPDPAVPLNVQLVELAGLPDNYDEDTTLKWYIATLAAGFGTDYTEFAPLPGGGLGTATQSTEMAARSRGKGPGVVLQQLEFGINWYVLPESTVFQFASTDPMAERERVMLKRERAAERALRIQSTEITPQQALVLAVEEGDAPEEFLPTDEDMEQDIEGYETMVKNLQDIRASYDTVERMISRRNGG